MSYEIGDKVLSAPIGRKDAFEGEVAEKIGSHTYHIRDKDGNLWHRTSGEIKLLEP